MRTLGDPKTLRTRARCPTMGPMSVVVEEAVSVPRATESRRLWVFFGVDCVLATVIRMVLAIATTGYSSDTQTFQSWAGTLRDHPLGDFYSTAYRPDHLPGDLWFLKLTVTVYDALGGHDVNGTGFALLTQVIPIVGDLLVGLMLLLLVRDLRDADSAGRAARWYLLNPATILLTGVWGQWDSLSLGILLAGAWCALHRRWWLVSAPLLTWAVLIKPQLALPALCLVLLLGHRLVSDGARGRLLATRAAGWLAAALVTAYVVLRPFGVGLLDAPAGGSTLAQRLHDALGVWPYTTVGAANIWMLPIRTSQVRRPDGGAGWLGVSAQGGEPPCCSWRCSSWPRSPYAGSGRSPSSPRSGLPPPSRTPRSCCRPGSTSATCSPRWASACFSPRCPRGTGAWSRGSGASARRSR